MYLFFFFFFKQKTAYEIVDCDWSSDVCSSDLLGGARSGVGLGSGFGVPGGGLGDGGRGGSKRASDRKSVV